MNTTLPSQGMSCYPLTGAQPRPAAGAPHLPPHRRPAGGRPGRQARPGRPVHRGEEGRPAVHGRRPGGQRPAILAANAQDLEAAQGTIAPVMQDRLRLTQGRIADMAAGVRAVAALPDPVGRTLASHPCPTGRR